MADNPDPSSLLPDVFSPATRDWFLRAFKQPTAVQPQTWHVAARSEHALVIAPTGSGKTLAAFLYALDRLFREGGEDTREAHKRKTSRILYISPIKALGTDVQRNLQIPLKGIADERRRRGSYLHARCANAARLGSAQRREIRDRVSHRANVHTL